MPAPSPTSNDKFANRPGASWVFASIPRTLAFGLGSGLLRPAPGTWGTLCGWLLWVLLVARLPDIGIGVALAVAFALGCWVCQRTGQELGQPDHGGMVWDEIVAFWLVLWLVPATWDAQLAAFVLFRAFDIVKPPPIRYFDRRIKNGFGVMFDDLIAAAYALLAMAILVRFGLFA
ncbi:phosphatidylglycerophosphatase A [Pusillimonas sp. TS35]|uniref:phosphatidylglycerophosphatase A family protein n=1 Tax=Paracandidimonas lactea TaxID=2895524 RepID=UPI0013684342|nr:phosphatidylglycerophosphatase A [Paracandidimonas lactea]MYN12876.1 phosphatidylglycerophosphatase A [Pusillimonas sp. TS35]